jgi:hypothetical protein
MSGPVGPRVCVATGATVVEEGDESEFWLDVLEVFKRGDIDTVGKLRQEASELRAITARARSTTLEKLKREAAVKRARTRKA